MPKYSEQLELIDLYSVASGTSQRHNCPACGGRNTLSLRNQDGQLFWKCFHAACDMRGRKDHNATPEQIIARTQRAVERQKRQFSDLPPMTDVMRFPDAMGYLASFGIDDMIEPGRIRYSPSERRVMFLSDDGQSAVGRSLTNTKFKWKKYGRTDAVYSYGPDQPEILILVEDCPSAIKIDKACAKAHCNKRIKAVSLTGTTINDNVKILVSGAYSGTRNIISPLTIVAFDVDAVSKAIHEKKKIRGRSLISVIKKDPKDMTLDELRKWILQYEDARYHPV